MSGSSGVQRFIGGLLLATGVLVTGLCGLCTGFFELQFLYESPYQNSGFVSFLIPLAVGFIPFCIGLTLVLSGRRLRRPTPGKGRHTDASHDRRRRIGR